MTGANTFKLIMMCAGMCAGLVGGSAMAQSAGVLDCEFKVIVPEGADFFTSNFRPFPVVGTKVQIDFSSQAITSMVFADGQVFFAEGEATLNRLARFGQTSGFGGVRQGNQGFYIGFLSPAQQSQENPEVFTSRFALTNAHRDENFHLVTQETHYGDLECTAVESEPVQ